MSHNTTQQTPQWADDCAQDIYEDFQFVDRDNETQPWAELTKNDLPAVAAIIARHAPKSWERNEGSEILAHIHAKDARIAELEAREARLLEAMSDIVESNGYNAALVAKSVLSNE